jgi:aspartyl-tRNA(Asn)/glutamyl-tRNA(Gln) amidotransferase subunit A
VSAGELALEPLESVRTGIATGELTAVSVTEACLAQIDRLDSTHRAFTRVHRDEALARAEFLDNEHARGVLHGPLHGVPVAVKDLFDIAGFPNSCGTAHRREAEPPKATAPAVAALTDAGAIVIGQTNLHEWALGGTSANPTFGNVINTWGSGLMPGGSSGGSGVAVSAGMAYVALGTDTGGSVREPASFTGTCALKVTEGAISTEGVFPVSWALDTVGPMARRVDDLRIPYDVMNMTGLRPFERPPRFRALAGTRLGIDRAYYYETERIEADVVEVFESTLAGLRELGVEIVDVSIPPLQGSAATFFGVCLPEAAAIHSGEIRDNRQHYGDDIQSLLALGDLVPAQDYIAAMRQRSVLRSAFNDAFHEVDFLVSPGTPFTATPVEQSMLTYPGGSSESLLDAAIRFTFPSNVAGIPTLCQPCGLSGRGLPVSIQFIGPPFAETSMLEFGSLVEEAMSWRFTPPGVSEDFVSSAN